MIPWELVNSKKRLLKDEKGHIKKDWGGRTPIALIYPNKYRIGMSNLGFLLVYQLLNQYEKIVCERVFLPEDSEINLHIKTNTPIISIESQRPLTDFPYIAFSISFEQDFSNILKILSLSRIPLLSKKRETLPLVIGGGVGVQINPEPLANIIDLFFIGEGEVFIEDIIPHLIEAYELGIAKEDLLLNLAISAHKGIYVPHFYKVIYDEDGKIHSIKTTKKEIPFPIKRAYKKEYQRPPFSSITTPSSEFGNTILMEVGRGCGRGCRFCAAGYIYRPPREFLSNLDLDELERLLDNGKRVGMISPAISDLENINEIAIKMKEKKLKATVSSIRADTLQDGLLELLKESGHKSIALAPDAATERMRKIINKGIQEEDILNAVRLAITYDIKRVRLYFMVGLPLEKWKDVEAIVSLARKCRHILLKEGRKKGQLSEIILSVNCFVPKPFTPFQWASMQYIDILKKKIRYLQKKINKESNMKIIFDLPKWAYIQALLARGDRRISRILLLAHKNRGNWKKTLRETDLNPDFYVYREREKDETFPWEIIDHGISRGYLWEEYKRATQEKISPPCFTGCTRCGIC